MSPATAVVSVVAAPAAYVATRCARPGTAVGCAVAAAVVADHVVARGERAAAHPEVRERVARCVLLDLEDARVQGLVGRAAGRGQVRRHGREHVADADPGQRRAEDDGVQAAGGRRPRQRREQVALGGR